jgi:type IV pilus assembly protein PilN
MLVEINLLPKKESKSFALLIIAGILILLLLASSFLIYWFGRGYTQDRNHLQKQISATQELVAIEQQKLVDFEASNSVTELNNTVDWAKQYPIKTVPVIQQLSSLLPDRGFMLDFTYEETGNIQLSVQFDTSREAAYYLTSLLDSEWVEDVRLLALTTGEWIYDEPDGQSETRLKNDPYIPRYVGDYEITLNRSFIKEEVTKEESSGQGGEDS